LRGPTPWREIDSVRRAVAELVALGPLPDERPAEVEALRRREALLAAIDRPLTDQEADASVGLFGSDGCYGLAGSVLDLIESTPSWPIASCLGDPGNEWIRTPRRRARSAGLLDESPRAAGDVSRFTLTGSY
jgi:hypothetical protein